VVKAMEKQELRRRFFCWIVAVFLSAAIPAVLTAVFCVCHQRSFPVATFVGYSVILLVAGGIYVVTLFDVWAEGKRLRTFPYRTLELSILFGVLLIVVAVTGSQTDFLAQEKILATISTPISNPPPNPGPKANPDPPTDGPGMGWWLLVQIGVAAIVLFFCVHLKFLIWLQDREQ
jgi:hypothetical protein